MELLDIIQKRYAVRAYKSDPVDDAKLQRILEAARLAPTAANRQPFKFIVIKTAGREAELKRIYSRDWLFQAPVLICVCAISAPAWVRSDGKNYCEVDAAIVMDHLILAATDAGLGTCWIAAFDPAAAREVLGIPKGVEPIAFTPIGYANDQPREKKRKTLSEIVVYDRWRE